MANSNIEKYKHICEQVGDEIPLFAQHWWWETITQAEGKTWDVLLSYNNENEIIGAMPYLLVKKWGMRFMLMPRFVQHTHIWTAPQLTSVQHQEVYINIIEQIKSINPIYCCLHFPPETTMHESFAEAGFITKERHTYRINDLDRPIEEIKARCSQSKRSRLKKSSDFVIDFKLPETDFFSFHKECLSLRNREISYSQELFSTLHNKAILQQQGQIIAIRSHIDQQLLAAIFTVWDNNYLYLLNTILDIRHKNTGAIIHLLINTIHFAQSKSKHFDFEGSMIPGVAKRNQEMGGSKTIYYAVERFCNPIIKYLWKLREKLLLSR